MKKEQQNKTRKSKSEKSVPVLYIGTKMIAFARGENKNKEQFILFVKSMPKYFEKSKYRTMKPKDDELLFGLIFTNKGTVDRFIKLLEEMKNDIKYDEIEDWEQGNK